MLSKSPTARFMAAGVSPTAAENKGRSVDMATDLTRKKNQVSALRAATSAKVSKQGYQDSH